MPYSREDEFYSDAMRYADPEGFKVARFLPRVIPVMGSHANKIKGRDYYKFRTEFDLLLHRDAARSLCDHNPLAIGFMDDLAAFVVGTGYAPDVKPPLGKGNDPSWLGLAKSVQRYLEEWSKNTPTPNRLLSGTYTNEMPWSGGLELECFRQACIDGEVFTRYFYDRETGLRVRRPEPEFIATPDGHDPTDSVWSWGTKHAINDDGSEDYSRITAYNLRDPIDLSDKKVPANKMGHWKRNVTSNVKRGVSDFLSLINDVERIDSLISALLQGAKLRASIAFIESLPGARQGASDDLASRLGERTGSLIADQSTGQVIYERRVREGTIVTTNSADFKTMPPGTTEESILAGEFAIRIAARRWGIPENMASGNVGNFNYSTMLAAGTPFVIRVLMAQIQYANQIVLMTYVHAILAAVYAGILQWDALRLLVSVHAPNPVIANKLEEAQVQQIRIQNKVLSPQAAMRENGQEPEETIRELHEWQDQFADATSPVPFDLAGGIDDGTDRGGQNGRNARGRGDGQDPNGDARSGRGGSPAIRGSGGDSSS